MRTAAILFDFSATLFDPTRVVDGTALAARARERGVPLDAAVAEPLVQRILRYAETDPGRRRRLRCDLSVEEHRAGWVATAAAVPGAAGGVAEAFHDCITDPGRWQPYPDTAATLAGLRAAGLRIGMVSNCGWDIRAAFRRAGLYGLVDAWALSCEHGRAKPDPELFRIACAALDTVPAEALMVGDDPRTDTGALAAGMPVHLLPPAPPFPAPRGLDLIRQLGGPDLAGRVLRDEEPIHHAPTTERTPGHRLQPGSGRLRTDPGRDGRPAR